MQAEKEIKIVEMENFSEGNFKVIKQFIVLERYLHFSGYYVGLPRYSDIIPVTLSKAKSLCVNNLPFEKAQQKFYPSGVQKDIFVTCLPFTFYPHGKKS